MYDDPNEPDDVPGGYFVAAYIVPGILFTLGYILVH